MKKLSFLIILFAFYSCKKSSSSLVTPVVPGAPDTPALVFSKILILGNSITQHPQDLSIGWAGNWGMAASAADKDYVHLLTNKFQTANQQSTVRIGSIASFEYDSQNFDFDANLKTLRDNKPDL